MKRIIITSMCSCHIIIVFVFQPSMYENSRIFPFIFVKVPTSDALKKYNECEFFLRLYHSIKMILYFL